MTEFSYVELYLKTNPTDTVYLNKYISLLNEIHNRRFLCLKLKCPSENN